MAGVTIFGSCFGHYDEYAGRWADAIDHMHIKPEEVFLAVDRTLPIPKWITQVVVDPATEWPIPGYSNYALSFIETEWAWRIDIDDMPLPDMLVGMDPDCDVWHGGYVNQRKNVYIPADVTAQEVLALPYNPILSCSAFRASLGRDVWYPDIAFDDWGFWRRMAKAGARFKSAKRTLYQYDFHPETSVSGMHASDKNTREALAQ